jgi:hypothetical protein
MGAEMRAPVAFTDGKPGRVQLLDISTIGDIPSRTMLALCSTKLPRHRLSD